MSKKLAGILLLMGCMSVSLPSSAFSVKIIRQTSAAEAEHISIKTDKATHAVTVLAKGCDACPLEFMTNIDTKYFLKQKQVNLAKAQSLSGRRGTVIYDADKNLVIRVRW